MPRWRWIPNLSREAAAQGAFLAAVRGRRRAAGLKSGYDRPIRRKIYKVDKPQVKPQVKPALKKKSMVQKSIRDFFKGISFFK